MLHTYKFCCIRVVPMMKPYLRITDTTGSPKSRFWVLDTASCMKEKLIWSINL